MLSIEDQIKEVAGEHYEWLLNQYRWFVYTDDFEQNYEYADNFRFADTSNPEQMDKLERQYGCCGSASWTFKHPSGKYYLMAWNYGH